MKRGCGSLLTDSACALLIQHVLHGEEIVPLVGDRMIDGIVSRMMAEEI